MVVDAWVDVVAFKCVRCGHKWTIDKPVARRSFEGPTLHRPEAERASDCEPPSW